MAALTLVEYGSTVANLSDETARALAHAAKDRLRVTLDSSGSYRVDATQHVGSIVVPGLTVLIRPKVPIDNVLLMLEAVDEPEWRAEDFGWDSTAGLLPAFAAFFTRTVERTIAAGLYRAYRVEHERTPAIRGRIDLTEQLRRPAIAVPIPCRFDEFTADVPENQILKAAVRRLARVVGLPPATHGRLRRLIAHLEEVADVAVDPSAIDRLHFNRLNERYEPALRLAQLVLRNLTIADRRGAGRASSFLIDMNLLFQDFVTQRLQRLLRRRLEVASEPPTYLADGKKVRMKPDLVFTRHGRVVFVADTKYKVLGDAFGRNGDYYQLLAYTTALDLTDGLLIYATADGPQPEKVIRVVETDKRLWTYPLDLAGNAAGVASSLQRLADWILERTAVVPAPLGATA